MGGNRVSMMNSMPDPPYEIGCNFKLRSCGANLRVKGIKVVLLVKTITEWILTEQAGHGSVRAYLRGLFLFEADAIVPRNKTTTQPTLTEQGRRRSDGAGLRRSIFVRKEKKKQSHSQGTYRFVLIRGARVCSRKRDLD